MAVELRILTDEATNTGFVLDLKPGTNFPLALTFSISSIRDIGKTKSNFSKTFRVPETTENNKNLSSIYYSSTSNSNTAKNLNRCIIVEDGIPLQKGWVRVKNVIETQSGREYELLFFGNNYAWIKGFRDINIRDLDFSSDNHTWNKSTVEASWGSVGAPADSDDRSYVYPVINYGEFGNFGVGVEDLRPAVFIKSILDKSFEVALDSTVEKYNVESTFLDSTYFKRLIMPFTNGEFTTVSNKDNGEDILANNTTQKIAPGFTASGNYEDIQLFLNNVVRGNSTSSPDFFSYYNTASSSQNGFWLGRGTYDVEIEFTFEQVNKTVGTGPRTRQTNSQNINFQIRAGGSIVAEEVLAFEDEGFQGVSRNETVIFRQTYTFEVNDAAYTAHHMWLWLDSDSVEQDVNMDILYSGSIKINRKDEVRVGDDVELAENLPDLKSIDIFKGIQHMYGLYVDTDEWTRTVKIDTRDTFYKTTAEAIDWTDKLDLSGGFGISYLDNYNRSVRFEYKQDSGDAYMSAYQDSNDILFGAGEIDLDARFPQGVTSFINPAFAATIHKRVNISTSRVPQHKQSILPTLHNSIGTEEEATAVSYNFEPRILFYDYSPQPDRDDVDITWKWEAIETRTDLPTGYFTDTVEGINLAQESLHFEGDSGLMPNYYSSLVGVLNEGVNVSAKFHLTKKDIQQLDLSKPIHISAPTQIAGYYTIEEVKDYIPNGDKTTTVILAKVVASNVISTKAKYKAEAEKLTGDYDELRGDWRKDDNKNAWSESDQKSTDKFKENYDGRFDIFTGYRETSDGPQDWDTTKTPKGDRESFSLNNGGKNFAAAGKGAVSFGTGAVAIADQQIATGSYNAISIDDQYMIGTGTSDTNRQTAWSIDKNGNPQSHGGNVYMQDSNGNLVEVITVVDNRYEKVYLSKETNG
jgi:hypothetical protein